MSEKSMTETSKQEANDLIKNVMTNGKLKKDFSRVNVVRDENSTITIPKGMPLKVAREWLERQEQLEEKVVTFHMGIKAYHLDGAYALYRAIKDIFGYVDLAAEETPSGQNPPHMIGLKLPSGETIQVPWGRMQFPGLDKDSYLETMYNKEKMEFEIHGKFKKKFEDVVALIAERTKEILKNDSIYKGQAIRVDLSFMDKKDAIPTDPEFLNVRNIKDTDVLMNARTRLNYSTVLLRIERSEECKRRNIPLKHGCLLAGPYGTGKTLTAKWTAKKAIENGWTFIYVEDCRQIQNALRLAELYAPAVVFAEDIDKAAEGERTDNMNAILNTLDGIDTKSHPIITILTTNHLENINRAFLRAGRIDSLIVMSPLDEETGMQFIKNFAVSSEGHSMLDTKDNYTEAAASLNGIVPAFASEVINKAKMNALYRGGEDEKITSKDIVAAAESFKEHIRITEGTPQPSLMEELGQATLKTSELLETAKKNPKAAAQKVGTGVTK